MGPHFLAAIAYLAAAVTCAAVAVVTWRRRSQAPTLAVTLILDMVGGCWWSVGLGVAVVATNQTVAAAATLAYALGPSLMAAAFVCFAYTVARPQWVPRRGLILGLLIEPVLNTLALATNPWLLLEYTGPGATALTGSAGWTYGPAFWLDTWYVYLEMSVGLGLIVWGWTNASPAFRTQRLALLIAALIPVAANAVFMIGGFGHVMDPTPLSFAVTGSIMSYTIFQQDLFTFSPVARALIVDQIGDAVMVVSPSGRVLDLNPAATDLVRAVSPHAPPKLVGTPIRDLFAGGLVAFVGHPTEIALELQGGPAQYHVQASPLIGRRHRDLGTVYVARDVTQARALRRRLSAAHDQLVRQVQTIDLLRADLVELASRDPLTGLHNRRHLTERFVGMLADAEVAGDTLAVVLFDVDEFKSVNDDHGHLAGDAVLRALGQLIQAQSPPGALVARWGGEEFFVALPGADAATGLEFAEHLRRACGQGSTLVNGTEIRCTVSGGVAAYPASGTTLDELFQAADHSMYEAKDAGRNLVRLHAGPVPSQRMPGTGE